MTLLMKIGVAILKITQIVTGFGPLLSQLSPQNAGTIATVQSELAQLSGVIVTVKAIGQSLGIKGPDKLKAAGPLVAQVILQSSLMAHHQIDNPALFQQASTKIADGIADLLNSLKSSGVQTTDKA